MKIHVTDAMIQDLKSYYESCEGWGEAEARAMDAMRYTLSVLGISVEGITDEQA